MRVWLVQLRLECQAKQGILLVDPEIIVDAETPTLAQQRAKDWFRHENPCATAPGEIGVRECKELEHIWFFPDRRFSYIKYDVKR